MREGEGEVLNQVGQVLSARVFELGLFLKIGQGPGAAVEGDIIWKSV